MTDERTRAIGFIRSRLHQEEYGIASFSENEIEVSIRLIETAHALAVADEREACARLVELFDYERHLGAFYDEGELKGDPQAALLGLLAEVKMAIRARTTLTAANSKEGD